MPVSVLDNALVAETLRLATSSAEKPVSRRTPQVQTTLTRCSMSQIFQRNEKASFVSQDRAFQLAKRSAAGCANGAGAASIGTAPLGRKYVVTSLERFWQLHESGCILNLASGRD